MDGFRAFKYYTAIRLHFKNAKFNVFTNKGHIKGSLDTFQRRPDRMLYEKLARISKTDKQCIQMIASNFMYGNEGVVYDFDAAVANYVEYIRRKQSITKIFTDDLAKITDSGAHYFDFSGQKIPDVIKLYIGGKITLETIVILDTMDDIVAKLRTQGQLSLLLGDDLLKIEKSRGFVKFDSYRVMSHYISFIEEVQGNKNGQNVSPSTVNV